MLKLEINTDQLLWIACIAMVIIILLYACWDVHYFLQMFMVQHWARLFQARLKLHETGVIYGFCIMTDTVLGKIHMNKARFARKLDFARLNFCERTGLRPAITRHVNGTVLQTVNFIRYLRNIPIFTFYQVTTNLVHWDERVLYLEHKFLSMDEEIVYATAIAKLNVLGLNIHDVISRLNGQDTAPLPQQCDTVKSFYDCINASSSRLRHNELTIINS